MFAGKNLRMTQKTSGADEVKKGLMWSVKNRCVHGR